MRGAGGGDGGGSSTAQIQLLRARQTCIHTYTLAYIHLYILRNTHTHTSTLSQRRADKMFCCGDEPPAVLICVCVCVYAACARFQHNYACMCESVSAPTVAALVYAGARERVRCGVMRCEWRHGAVQNAAAVDGGELQ